MTLTGKQYAEALYQLALEEGLCDPILQELTVLEQSFRENPDYLRLLHAPSLSKQERCDILQEAFGGKLHSYTLNTLKLMTEKGCIRHFPDACRAYAQLYNADHGILCVTAITALALTQDQATRLAQKLSAITGKTIQLENRVEESCLGGVRLEYDGKCVDDTLAHRLDSVSKLLKNTVI